MKKYFAAWRANNFATSLPYISITYPRQLYKYVSLKFVLKPGKIRKVNVYEYSGVDRYTCYDEVEKKALVVNCIRMVNTDHGVTGRRLVTDGKETCGKCFTAVS